MKRQRQGFTLIELLIVIAIVAILAVVVVLTINPARMIDRSKDAQRISDLSTVVTALNLYLADNKDFSALNDATTYLSTDGASDNARKKNDGTGWIPIDFSSVSSGAPISTLPLDPDNTGTSIYSFKVLKATKTYELDGVLSTENTAKMTGDGGDSATKYEVGTNLTLIN